MKSAFGATLFFILMGYALILPSTAAAAGPVSTITSPKYLSIINTTSVTNSVIVVTGTATTGAGATVSKVEVSVNGSAWKLAAGTSSWTFSFKVHTSAIYHIRSRATDSLGNEEPETPDGGVKVDVVLPSATYSVSGTITDNSTMVGGDVIAAAFTDQHFVGGNPLVYKDLTNPGPFTGPYTLDSVPAGTFYIGAVKTVVSGPNVDIQATDPAGAYGGMVAPLAVNVFGNRTGINITMNDRTALNPNPLYQPAKARAEYNDWGSGTSMWIDFEYQDTNHTASTVTVAGPGIAAGSPISLVYDTTDKRWISWGANGGPSVSLQLDVTNPGTWPVLPLTYTFTVTGGPGAGTRTGVVKSYMRDVPTLKTPSESFPQPPPDVNGSVIFSWAPVPMGVFYEVGLYDPSITNGNNQVWSSSDGGGNHNFTGHSIRYNGPALVDGHTYGFSVLARDVNDNEATDSSGSFVYHTSTDIIAPTSTIGQADGSLVTGDYLLNTGISGTALDDIGGSGVQAVEVSIDGGTNWYIATDTSGNGSWSNWNITWPPSGPPINGPLSIMSRAIDDANNFETPAAGITITIDKDKPASAITAPANGVIVKTAPLTITGTASDTLTAGNSGVDKVELSLDGGSTWKGQADGVTDTSGYPTSGLPRWSTWSYSLTVDGVYPLQCRATDMAGNQSTVAAPRTVTLDTTPPILTVNTPIDGAEINTGTTASISGTASDATSGMKKVEVQVINANTHAVVLGWTQVTGTATWSYNWTLPLDGIYTINVRATDNAGNVTTPTTRSVTVDKTKPTVVMTAPTIATVWIKGTSFNVTGTASDATSGVDSVFVKVDAAVTWTPVTSGTTAWSYTWSPLPSDGPHTIQAKAVDKAGNIQTTAVVPVNVDMTLPPPSVITLPNPNTILDGASYVIKGTASDATSGVRKVEISTDGGTTWDTLHPATGTTSWSYTWTVPANGSYNILSRATDVAGNVEDTSSKSVVPVTVNKTMPISAITAPLTGKALKGPAAITGTAFKGASATSLTKVEVSINGGAWALATDTSGYPTSGLPRFSTWSYAWTPTTEGPCALVSKATNNLTGGVEDNTNKAAVNVTYDKTPPSTAITSPPTLPAGGANLSVTPVSITGTAGDSGVSPSGVVKVEVGITPAVVGGLTTWITLPNTATSDSWAHWTYNWPLPADGLYTLYSRATDRAGNVKVSASVSVRVDKTKPTVALTAPPLAGISVPTALGTYTIKGTAADTTGSGVQKVEVSTDNGAHWATATGTTAWSYPWVLTSDGTYIIMVKATDNANNVSLIPARTVKVDSVPPAPSVITLPNNNATLDTASYVIKGTASDALSGVMKVEVGITPSGGITTWTTLPGTATTDSWAHWTYTWNLVPITLPTNFTIQCRATDNAGNVESPVGAGVTVTVNKTMPTSAITAPVSGKALKGTTMVTGTAFKGASATATSVTKVEVFVSTDGGLTWDAGHTATDTSGYPTSGLPRLSTWSYSWTPTTEGPYTLVSKATNNLGVEVITNKPVVNVTFDMTPPSTAITSPPTLPAAGANLSVTPVSITGTAGDTGTFPSGVVKVEVGITPLATGLTTWIILPNTATVDSWADWTYSWTLPADGGYTLKSRATDGAGNVTVSTPVSVRVDRTRPASAITSPPTLPAAGAFLSGASKTITGTAGDPGGSGVQKVEIKIINAGTGATVLDWTQATGTTSWSYDWNPLPVVDGNYNIKCRATDNAGNVQIPGVGNTVKVDNTPPAVAITAPASGTLINNALTRTITGTASDTGGSGVSGVAVSFDGGGTWKPAVDTSNSLVTGKAPWSTWSYAWTITTTATTSITARATDKALNSNTDIHAVTVSPKLFSGTWNYTYTPVTPPGTANSGTVPLTATDAGGLTIVVPNKCISIYTGTFSGMSAALTSTNEDNNTCTGTGDIVLNFTNMKNATGTVTTPGSTATLKIWR